MPPNNRVSLYTGNRPGHHKLGSIGPSIGKCRTKIFNPDSDGEGEIIMSSRNIMMGYLFNEEKTKEAIDEEGWMHSGDLGTQLENEYFKVILFLLRIKFIAKLCR